MAKATPTLVLLLSGGTGNSNPNASIGGQASQHALKMAVSQTYTQTAIPGLTINHASRNPDGNGTLSFTASNKQLTWQNPLGVTSSVIITDQTKLALGFTDSGYLRFAVVPGSLPVIDYTETIAVAQADYTLFHKPSSTELTAGLTDYRALYLWNQSSGPVTGVTLTLTDNAPQSVVTIGSAFNSLSQFFSPSSEGLDFRTVNYSGQIAPYAVSMSPLIQRERLILTTEMGTPSFSYFPPDYQQDSNGIDQDVEILLTDSVDSTNKLAGVEFGTSIYWSQIGAGRMVSFWTKRAMPANPTLPTTEWALFDIAFTIS